MRCIKRVLTVLRTPHRDVPTAAFYRKKRRFASGGCHPGHPARSAGEVAGKGRLEISYASYFDDRRALLIAPRGQRRGGAKRKSRQAQPPPPAPTHRTTRDHT